MGTTSATTAPGGPFALALINVKDWLLQRGILFVLLLAPVFSLFLGLFRVTAPRLGYLTMLLAFALLPIWVVARRNVSNDPGEPAQQLHRYALYALFPYVMFSVVRIPMFYLFRFPYWTPWYGFGVGATGEAPSTYASLIPGAILYSLQGYSLAMGFYVLFKQHSLLNALLFFGVFVAALYSYVFPVFLMVGARPGPAFHTINAWAHAWMGLTAWSMPRFWRGTWPRLARGARVAAVGVLTLVWVMPYAFAFGQATLWQFGQQAVTDRAVFARPGLLALGGHPALVATGTTGTDAEARYQFLLRLGPRSFTDYAKLHRAIGVEDLHVTGRLVHQGATFAWCSANTDQLETPNTIRDPEKFFPALQRLDYVDIVVACVGSPPAGAIRTGMPVQVAWTAQLRLLGEREQARGGSARPNRCHCRCHCRRHCRQATRPPRG
jgi:hypothetical protein